MFVANALYACGQWLTLMLLTKVLRPEQVGQYALSLAIVYPVIALTSFQLRAVIASGMYGQTHFGHFLGLRLYTTLLALVAAKPLMVKFASPACWVCVIAVVLVVG